MIEARLSDIVKGDVISIPIIDRTSDTLLVAKIEEHDKDCLHVCFSGGLNYVLSKNTKCFKQD